MVSDGTTPPAVTDSYSDYVQTGTPGCRAPHVWLGRPDARLSTLDLLGPAFTLLAAPKADGWCAAASKASRELDVRVDCHRIGSAGLRTSAASAPPTACRKTAPRWFVPTGTSVGAALRPL